MRGPAAREIAATAKAEMKHRHEHLLTLAHYLDAIIEAAPNILTLDAGIVDVLRDRRAAIQELADRIRVQMHTRSWLYFGLLQEAENAGINLNKYTSPPKGKPYGSSVDYLVAKAAEHGHSIGPDRAFGLLKEFNALPQIGPRFDGEGNMSVCADVVHSPLWFWMWLV
jgi:hypothetical protein